MLSTIQVVRLKESYRKTLIRHGLEEQVILESIMNAGFSENELESSKDLFLEVIISESARVKRSIEIFDLPLDFFSTP